jgi:hypothetical protein
MVNSALPTGSAGRFAWRLLRTAATVVLYSLMLLAVLALWNSKAPQFIYVAF